MQQAIVQLHVRGPEVHVRALASAAQNSWNARGLVVLSVNADQTAHIVNMRPQMSLAGKGEMLRTDLDRICCELQGADELVISDLLAW